MGEGGSATGSIPEIYCRWCGALLSRRCGRGRQRNFCDQQHKNAYHNRKKLQADPSEDMKLVLSIRKQSMAKYSMLVTQPLQALGNEYGSFACELAWRAITAAIVEEKARWSVERD